MRRLAVLVAASLLPSGCGDGNPENSASCGFALMAGATMVLEQMAGGTKLLSEPPPGLVGTVPARVVGYGTRAALAAEAAEGVLVGYDGPGFPSTPGFGLVLVEDSADAFMGVLIFDREPPRGFPRLGTVASGEQTIPLYGSRVTWSMVSSPRCPLFGALDTAVVDTASER